jgi:hypothetical protein
MDEHTIWSPSVKKLQLKGLEWLAKELHCLVFEDIPKVGYHHVDRNVMFFYEGKQISIDILICVGLMCGQVMGRVQHAKIKLVFRKAQLSLWKCYGTSH